MHMYTCMIIYFCLLSTTPLFVCFFKITQSLLIQRL